MKENTKKELYSWVKPILFALFITVICRVFIFTPVTVFGDSMFPTFKHKDMVVVSKISKIQRFDTIIFDAPDVAQKQYIKRVIGLPGDKIVIKDDKLYVNDVAYEESYVNKNSNDPIHTNLTGDFDLQKNTNETMVPENHYFVLGDNRWHSNDSREFGFIEADSVIGEVKFRYFPFENVGIIE